MVSVLDGHSHTLAFIGAALGVTQAALGVDTFGQSGARRDLYRHYGIDAARDRARRPDPARQAAGLSRAHGPPAARGTDGARDRGQLGHR